MKQRHALANRPLRALVLGLALTLGAGVPTLAQETDAGEPDWEALRQRWEQKTDDERAVLRRRFEKLMELSDADRSLFLERGRRVGREKRRWEASNEGGDFRAELRRRARDHGPRYRQQLPERLLEELRGLPSERRAARLEHHFKELRRDEGPRMLERLGRRLRLENTELERLRRLPEPNRMRRMMELRRRQLEGEGRRGEWRGLSDEEFLERVRERRGRGEDPPGRRQRRRQDV